MKRLLIFAFVAMMMGTAEVQAQNWLDALKNAATTAVDKVTGGKLTAATIYGTWKYSQPGIKLSSSEKLYIGCANGRTTCAYNIAAVV